MNTITGIRLFIFLLLISPILVGFGLAIHNNHKPRLAVVVGGLIWIGWVGYITTIGEDNNAVSR